MTRHRWPALLTLCLAVLIAQVDTAVVNLAVRPIGQYFSAGAAALQWTVDSYNLVYAVLLLSGGLLADLHGRRRIFVTGAAIFTAASLGCALAPTIAVLVAARAVAGLGAALLLPASLAIIRVGWPDDRDRARALGLWAACNGLALAIGPTLGGVLMRWAGWRSIFFVVVPAGAATIALAPRTLDESSDPQGRHGDAAGQVLGAIALGALACAAVALHDDARLAGIAFAAALLALIVFIRTEAAHGAAAMVPLDLFRAPVFTAAMMATTGMTFGMYGVLFLLPLTWQGTQRLDVLGAGIALMPMALMFVLSSPFSGALTRRLGPRPLCCGGVAVIAAGLLTIAGTAGMPSLLPALLGLTLTGLGMGLATGPLMGLAVGAVAAARAGTASALINVARMSGATIGVALLGTLHGLAGGGTAGLRLAMLLGAAVQLACAATAWVATRPRP
ncbi:MFS transporter [Vineibacter terrae]|uniref:MFS transporter n=1 Tax=Vineibacter terrae TaxID=2586908 RepID=UPI001C498B3E|nr:MFS transporter [Vineibacter terrae]